MGQVKIRVTLRNAREVVMAHLGHLPETQIYTYDTDALIDTGATRSCLPPWVADQLGLVRLGYTGVTLADGRLVEGQVTEAVDIEIERRRTQLTAIVIGTQVLIGVPVLEELDLAVDTVRGRLMPNIGTWDQPLFRV